MQAERSDVWWDKEAVCPSDAFLLRKLAHLSISTNTNESLRGKKHWCEMVSGKIWIFEDHSLS